MGRTTCYLYCFWLTLYIYICSTLSIFWMVMLMVHSVYVICPCGILELGTQVICNVSGAMNGGYAW